MGSVAYADALIACYDAKYPYTLWRPITAIRGRDRRQRRHARRSGQGAAPPRDSESPRVPQRPLVRHPRRGTSRRRVPWKPTIDFTIPSLTVFGDRHFATVRLADQWEVGQARIWGGIHFRSAVEDGVKIGTHVANWVLAHHFHRSQD